MKEIVAKYQPSHWVLDVVKNQLTQQHSARVCLFFLLCIITNHVFLMEPMNLDKETPAVFE